MPASNTSPDLWESYKRRKMAADQDHNIFCPDEPWEFTFLVDTIIAAEPHLDQMTVMLAVRQRMRETVAPRQRSHFVNAVMASIRERENYFARIFSAETDH